MSEEKGSLSYISLVCGVAALGGLLFGYDTAVVSGAIGFLTTKFHLTAGMVGWTASSALAGCVVGVSMAGVVSDKFGRKKVLILAAFLYLVSAIGTAIPDHAVAKWLIAPLLYLVSAGVNPDLVSFIIYRIVGGIGVGIASMASPMYIAEITPARIRGRMVSVNQFAIVTGMLVVYFVNYFIAEGRPESWNVEHGWRWMFGSEALPAAIFLLLLFFVPESPRYLVELGKEGEAQRILTRVGGPANAEAELVEIRKTLQEESGSFMKLFGPGLLGLLGLGVALAVLQQVTGINVFLYYGPEIFKKLGSGTDTSLIQTVVVGAVNLLFTILAIGIVDRVGRKPLMLIGSLGMGVALAGMGLSAQMGSTSMWVLLFMLGYIACFAMSVGPVIWVILSEIYPTKLRGRAMSVCTFCLWTANLVVSWTFPMMDGSETLIRMFNHAFPFYIYGALCVVLFLVVLRKVPETKGKSLEEIEHMLGVGRGAGSAP